MQIFIPILYPLLILLRTHEPLLHTCLHTRSSIAYVCPFTFKPCTIAQPTLTSNLHQTRTITIQPSYNHNNAFLTIPTSLDHSSNSPTLTIDATTTTTASITNSLHYNHYATPPLSSFNQSSLTTTTTFWDQWGRGGAFMAEPCNQIPLPHVYLGDELRGEAQSD